VPAVSCFDRRSQISASEDFSSPYVRLIEKNVSLVNPFALLDKNLSRIMSTRNESPTLLLEQLHLSISLLGLLTERPADLDELILDNKELFLENRVSENADSREDAPEDDLEDVEIISAQDEKQRNPKVLRNKVLDRLAETLARYKSDPTANKGPILDSKHVSSTMMIVDEKHNKVKILCSKNEGLDQHNTTDDTDFLNSWKASMEHIARKGGFVYCKHPILLYVNLK
jgi:hypothetical protein